MALSELEKRRKLNTLEKYLNPEYSLGKPYDVFNQSEFRTQSDLNQIKGILDVSDELNIGPELKESLTGVANVLDEKIANYGKQSDFGGLGILDTISDFGRGANQKIASGLGWAVDTGLKMNPKSWFNEPTEDLLSDEELREVWEGSEQSLNNVLESRRKSRLGISPGDRIVESLGNVNIGYGSTDERTLPTDYATKAGGYTAEALPYMFGIGNMIRSGTFNPFSFGKTAPMTAPVVTGTFKGPQSNILNNIMADMRRFSATNPGVAVAGEALASTGYGVGMPYAEDTLNDPTASFVEKAWATTVPVLTTGGFAVAPVGAKEGYSAVAQALRNSFDIENNMIGNAVKTLWAKRPQMFGGKNQDLTWREAWGGAKSQKDIQEEGPGLSINPTRMGNRIVNEVNNFFDNIGTQIKLSPAGKKWGKGLSTVFKTENAEKYESILQAVKKDYPQISETEAIRITDDLVEKALIREKGTAKINNILLSAKENPALVLEEISKINKVLMKQQGVDNLDDLIGIPTFVASGGDDISKQSPTLMALTNYEIKNSEPFAKRIIENTQRRREYIDKEIKNILGGADTEFSAMSVADATELANRNYDRQVVREIMSVLDDHNARNKQLGIDDVTAGNNAIELLRRIDRDVRVSNNQKWEALKSEYGQETTEQFNQVRNSILKMQEQDFELINLPPKIKERVLRLTTFNSEKDTPINFGEVDKLRKSVNLALRQEYKKIDSDPNTIDSLKSLQTSLNDDMRKIFPFTRDASDSTRVYHNLFTRQNEVYNWIRKNNQGTYDLEGTKSLDHLFGSAGQSNMIIERDPFALKQWKNAIYGGSKLAYKDINKIKQTVNESEAVFKSVIANMAEESFDKQTNTFNPNILRKFLVDNRKLLEMFPENKKLIKMYLKDITRLQKDLDNNVFGVANIEKDPITNRVTIARSEDSVQKAQLKELLLNDNPSVALEGIMLDEANGHRELMRLVNGVKSLNDPDLTKAFKTSLIEGLIRSGYIQGKDGITGTQFKQLFNRTHGSKFNLRQSLKETKLFNDKELSGLDDALKLYELELGAFNNPQLFAALKDVDPTNTMIDTFARVLAANFSTNFSTGPGAGLVIAGRFTRLTQGLLQDIKTPAVRDFIQELLLDSAKFEKYFKEFSDVLNIPLTEAVKEKTKRNAFNRVKAPMYAVGIELNWPDFEKAWDQMTYEERLNQGRLDALKYGVQ